MSIEVKSNASGLTNMKSVDVGTTPIGVTVSRGVGVIVLVGVGVLVGVCVAVAVEVDVLVGPSPGMKSNAVQACRKSIAMMMRADLCILTSLLRAILIIIAIRLACLYNYV